jgi:pyruvoyl-dependent arginine decarboxylase (PvlArgDC)
MPEDRLAGIPLAMTELIMDRFVGNDTEENNAFNCVPMRIGDNVVAVSFILSQQVNHVTEDGITEIPAGTGLTVIVQEYIIGKGEQPVSDEDTVQLWQLKDIL